MRATKPSVANMTFMVFQRRTEFEKSSGVSKGQGHNNKALLYTDSSVAKLNVMMNI